MPYTYQFYESLLVLIKYYTDWKYTYQFYESLLMRSSQRTLTYIHGDKLLPTPHFL